MQNALWKGEPLIAYEIAQDDKMDNCIRMASKAKELHCPDPDCEKPFLCYRHGEKRIPHFAHNGNNVVCDYAKFDSRNNEIQRKICQYIYEILADQGFNVKMEVKLFGHQYTHLTIEHDTKILAIQIAPYNISAKKASNWIYECQKNGIEPLWIFIGAEERSDGVYEESNYGFIYKRHRPYSLVCKNVFIVNNSGFKITRYNIDPNMSKYEYNGRCIDRMNYDFVYFESATLENLTLEDSELSIKGYNGRYKEWLTKRMDIFKQEIIKIEEREQRLEKSRRAEQQRRAEEQIQNEDFELGCNEQIQRVREKIYNHFSSHGYSVEKYKKALPNHYSHLLFDFNGEKLAIEVIDDSISKRRVEELINQYQKDKIQVQWVVSVYSDYIEDKQPCYAHKELLETTDLIFIGFDEDVVSQQINDPNIYKINGVEVTSENYPEWYMKPATLEELICENNRLTLPHFHDDYQKWLEKKQRKFKDKRDAEEKQWAQFNASKQNSDQLLKQAVFWQERQFKEERRREEDRQRASITEAQKQKVRDLLAKNDAEHKS